ncbi:MAG: 30S ribosomal protein S4 [Phycisphaerae bacterium]|nr:30S ribosomal protein S4 [Phycisphaerae bacterium]
MGRCLGPVCRQCRREGMKLFLKGLRCETAKCPIEKQSRNKVPGMHNWRRGRNTDYGVRLREKQKVKRYYGVLEKQFRIYFDQATKAVNTGEALLCILERRLDNVVYKMNFTDSRRDARQLINHGHIYVNGTRVDVASFLVKIGDKVTIGKGENTQKMIKAKIEAIAGSPTQNWIEVNSATPEGTVVAFPSREDVQIPVEEHLIVEFCSK